MFTKTQFTIQIYAQVFLKHQLLNGVYYYEYNKIWRLWTILSNKNVSVNVFWYVKVYLSWKFIQYTTHWDKTQKSSQKMHSFFFRELITVFSFSFSFFFLLIRAELQGSSLSNCVWDFLFPASYQSLFFCSIKNMDCLPLKLIIPFKIKTIEKPHSLASRPLIFKLHQGVLKIQWYLCELELPKNLPGNQFFKLKSKFWVRHFFTISSQDETRPVMKKIYLHVNSIWKKTSDWVWKHITKFMISSQSLKH